MTTITILTGKYDIDFPIHEKDTAGTTTYVTPEGIRILTEQDLNNLSEDVTFDNSIIEYNEDDLVHQIVTNYDDGSQRILNMIYNSEDDIYQIELIYKSIFKTFTYHRDSEGRIISITT